MRTNIDLADTLVSEAMKVTGLGTKKAVVEEALRRLVRAAGQSQAIADMAGLGCDSNARPDYFVRSIRPASPARFPASGSRCGRR